MSVPPPIMLPPLRRDLVIRPDEPTAEGEPTWTVHDPASGKFISISWSTKEILDRWRLGQPKPIADSICHETTLLVDEEDVMLVAQSLLGAGLLDLRGADNSKGLAEQLAKRQPGFWQWLLHNYLFIRIPLFNPDPLLDWLTPKLAFLYSRFFLLTTALAAALGLGLVVRQWDRFYSVFLHHLSLQGAAWFAFVLFLAKVCHEFGHAVTAKRHGAKVPKMGIALIVMFPMLYTDTNDVWRLGNRRHRLQVSIAGVATEMLIACWATLAWGLLPEGHLSDACFLLATTTWVTTVLLNLSPFMRFDGYFVLSDWSGIANLHEEAGALGRWKLRQLLFGIDDPMPAVTAPSKARWLVVFAWVTWLYRLSVFLGIAVLVYHFAVKLLGIAMFVVELGYFILYPIYIEIREWARRSDRIKVSPRARILGAILLLALAAACLPWPTRVHVAGYLRTDEDFYLYAPEEALVARLLVKDGDTVKAGQPLADLESAKLTQRLREGAARVRRFEAEIASARVSEGLSERLPVLIAQRDTTRSQLAATEEAAVRLRPTAPADGVVRWIDPELAPGAWVAREEPLLVIRRPGLSEAFAYVDDEAVQRLRVGSSALFFLPAFSAQGIPMEVVAIDRDIAQVLASPTLAEGAGGTVPSRLDARGNATPTRSMYRLTLRTREAPLPYLGHDWRGRLVIRGEGEAPVVHLYRAALSLLWREAGF